MQLSKPKHRDVPRVLLSVPLADGPVRRGTVQHADARATAARGKQGRSESQSRDNAQAARDEAGRGRPAARERVEEGHGAQCECRPASGRPNDVQGAAAEVRWVLRPR